MSVLLYGGSFDPIGIHHLAIAQEASSQLGIDRVLLLPCVDSPNKTSKLSFLSRLNMCKLAVENNPRILASDLELRIKKPGRPSYTVDLVRALDGLEDMYLLIGGDSLSDFHTWHEYAEILKLCHLVVMPRSGEEQEVHIKSENITYLDGIPLGDGISSSWLRQRISDGKSIKYFVPDSVEMHIERFSLYGKESLAR